MYVSEEKNVLTVVHQWIEAYQTRNIDLFKKIIATSETHISWGTGKDERYIGKQGFLDFLLRDFEQSSDCQLKIISQYLAVHPHSDWVALEVQPTVTIHRHAHTLEILRVSLVLLKTEHSWFIEHTHGSWPYPDQKEGQSFPND